MDRSVARLPEPETFDYDRYLAVKEKRDRFIGEWAGGLHPREVPVLISPPWDIWNNNMCAFPERMLRWNLWAMEVSATWPSDSVFQYIEMWYGVGIYAIAFGCRYLWNGESAPQTRPIYSSVDQVARVKVPDPHQVEIMQEVLERMRWVRRVTGDRLPICLTDAQSANDTASLILETNEFFSTCVAAPDQLAPLMNAIDDLIIAFTEIQLEELGPTAALPGHQMLCHPDWKGVSVSDDNMAMLSPRAYEAASLPYNSRLGEYFGGIALHSCGRIRHNIPAQLRTRNLHQMECSTCCTVKDTDPSPNRPDELRDGYRGSGVILRMRIHKDEVDLLDRLLAPDLKVVLAVTGVETRAEAEQVYQCFKERIAQITARWPDAGGCFGQGGGMAVRRGRGRKETRSRNDRQTSRAPAADRSVRVRSGQLSHLPHPLAAGDAAGKSAGFLRGAQGLACRLG